MRFEFATAPRILFGAGTLREVGAIARTMGRRALVVTGRDPGRAGTLLAVLKEHEAPNMVFALPVSRRFQPSAPESSARATRIVIG